MFSDDFLLANGVHHQKKNFQLFLREGLINELDKFFPLSTSLDGQAFTFEVDTSNYVFKKPSVSPHQAITEAKSYKTELYIPVTWLLNKVPIAPPSFLFFGELPMMTEEGHFILNGSARNVVGQLVRSPGIYYKVRLGKKNKRRFLISFLSEHGCWFRIWTDQWGRIWVRMNKLRTILFYVLIRAVGIPESLLLRLISINKYFLFNTGTKFSLNYYFANSFPKGIIFLYLDIHRGYSQLPMFLNACNFLFRMFFQPQSYSFGKAGRQFLDYKLNRSTQITQSLKPEDIIDAFEKLAQLERGILWNDNIDHLQNRRVRSVNELLQNEMHRGLELLEKDFSRKIEKLYQRSMTSFRKILDSEKKGSIEPYWVPIKGKETFLSLFTYQSNYKFNLSKNSTSSLSLSKEEMSKPLIFFSNFCLNPPFNPFYKNFSFLEKKEISSKNFFFFGTMVKQSRFSSFGSSIKTNIKQKQIENSFLNKLEKPPSRTKHLFSVYEKEKGVGSVFYPKFPVTFFQFLLNPEFITTAVNQFFALHPLSQLLDQSNPLSSAAHRRRFTSLGPGGVNRDAGLAVRDIHPSHYGRVCPIETPEGKNAGLVHSLAMYADITAEGILCSPFFYRTHSNFNFVFRLYKFWKNFEAKKNSVEIFSYNEIRKKKKKSFKTTYTCENPFSFFSKNQIFLKNYEKPRFFSSEEEFFFTKGKPYFFTHPFPSASFQLSKLISSSEFGERSKENVFLDSGIKKDWNTKISSNFRSISPIQILSLATSLIPFLEHDDANRALMGSNMQRQAVSLFYREKPIVGTGFEKVASQALVARKSGIIYKVDTNQVILRSEKSLDIYPLRSFSRSNQASRIHEGPFTQCGELILAGSAFGDKESMYGGDLALGRNLLLGYLPWEGYNFEDAVVISDRLVQEDVYTSIHIERYSILMNHRIGEILTPYPSDLMEEEYKNLDSDGIVHKGIYADKETILIGKHVLLPQHSLTPSFKLRARIFQAQPPYYENTSYRLNRGSGGRILRIQLKFRKKPRLDYPFSSLFKELNKQVTSQKLKNNQHSFSIYRCLSKKKICRKVFLSTKSFETVKKNKFSLSPLQLTSSFIHKKLQKDLILDTWIDKEKFDNFYSYKNLLNLWLVRKPKLSKRATKEIYQILETGLLKKRSISTENLSTALSSFQIFIATKRRIQIGDKVAGRHGNKGIISLILPRAHMPYLQDGTALDMVLNPLGVPSRMNLGQLFESLLGLAGKHLRQSYKIVPFDEIHTELNHETQTSLNDLLSLSKFKNKISPKEISRNLVYNKLYLAKKKTGYSWLFNGNIPGKTYIFDGRTGNIFFQPVTVGISYILKLGHLVDDKMHARTTGPYALVTQQPLRGKAQEGGQRLGEMEIWALEGFGAAYILQEVLTLKSDDLDGRATVFDSILGIQPNLDIYQLLSLDDSKNLVNKSDLFEKNEMGQNDRFRRLPKSDIIDLPKSYLSWFSESIKTPTLFNDSSTFSEYNLNSNVKVHYELPQDLPISSPSISDGFEMSYLDEQQLVNNDERVHNLPESFQLLFSELQALCLDMFHFSV